MKLVDALSILASGEINSGRTIETDENITLAIIRQGQVQITYPDGHSTLWELINLSPTMTP